MSIASATSLTRYCIRCLRFMVIHTLLGMISLFFFFFNDTATTEIYTLSLHDALPISLQFHRVFEHQHAVARGGDLGQRSEEHTSELQSPDHLVCRLLLEKKKINPTLLHLLYLDSPPPPFTPLPLALYFYLPSYLQLHL